MMMYLRLIRSLFALYVLRRRVPLFVLMMLTNRCNSKCKYCNIYLREKKELSTERVLQVIDEFAELGTVRIGFYGGEPLLRNDIDSIITYAKKRGLMVHIYSNGLLAEKHIDTLAKTDGVFLSLDGRRDIHDEMRCPGSFDMVVDAVTLCRKRNIPVFIMSVLTNRNIGEIDFLNGFSFDNKCPLNFQVVSQISELSSDVADYRLSDDQLRACLQKLLELKKTNPYLALSNTYLTRLLKRPPGYQRQGYQLGIIKCWNGTASCQIDSGGNLHSCLQLLNKEPALNLNNHSAKEAFGYIKPCSCTTCELSCSVEYNLWLSLNPEAVLNVFKLFIKTAFTNVKKTIRMRK